MPLPLQRLRSELAKTTIEVLKLHGQEKISSELNMQFTFNGFAKVSNYQNHLRHFYDQLKDELEQSTNDIKDIDECFDYLDSIELLLKECDKLDRFILKEYHFSDFGVSMTDGVRLEADNKKHFRKK